MERMPLIDFLLNVTALQPITCFYRVFSNYFTFIALLIRWIKRFRIFCHTLYFILFPKPVLCRVFVLWNRKCHTAASQEKSLSASLRRSVFSLMFYPHSIHQLIKSTTKICPQNHLIPFLFYSFTCKPELISTIDVKIKGYMAEC